MANWIDLARHGAAAWRTNFGIQVLPISPGVPISGVAEDGIPEKNGFSVSRAADGTIVEVTFGGGTLLPGMKPPLPPLQAVLRAFPGCQIRPMDESMLVPTDIAKRPSTPYAPSAQWLWEVDLTDIRGDSVMLVPHDSDDLPLRLFTTTQELGLIYADALQVKLASREKEPRYFLQREPGGGYWAVSASALKGMAPQRLARLRQESSPALRFAWHQAPAPAELVMPVADIAKPEAELELSVPPAAKDIAPEPEQTQADLGADVQEVSGGDAAEEEDNDGDDSDGAAGHGRVGERTAIVDFGQKIGGARKDAYAELNVWRQSAIKDFKADVERVRGVAGSLYSGTEVKEFQHAKIKDILMPALPMRTLRAMLENGHDPLVLAFREFVRAKMPSRLSDMIAYNWNWRRKRNSSHFSAACAIEAGDTALRLCDEMDRVFLDPKTSFSEMMDAVTRDVLVDESLFLRKRIYTQEERAACNDYQNTHHLGNRRMADWCARYESLFPALTCLLTSKTPSDRREMGHNPVTLGGGMLSMLSVARGLAAHVHGSGFDAAPEHRALFDIANYQLSLSRREDPEEVAKADENIANFWSQFELAVKGAKDDADSVIAAAAGVKATSKARAKSDPETSEEETDDEDGKDDKAAVPRRIFLLNGRKAPTPPRYEDLQRTGPDRHAQNSAVSPEMLAETFGFRAIEWGNWVTQPERAAILNLAYDSFSDMAEALGVPPEFMGFHGRLAVSFGARGRGGHAAAHYEPVRAVLHLTKTMGAGTVGHEWTHALDHFLAERLGLGQYAFLTRTPTKTLETTDTGRVMLSFMSAMKDRRALEEASGIKVGDYAWDSYKKTTILALEDLFDETWLQSFQSSLTWKSERAETEVPADALDLVREFLAWVAEQHTQKAREGNYEWPGLLRGMSYSGKYVAESFFQHQARPDDADMRLIADAVGSAMQGRRFINLWKKQRNTFAAVRSQQDRTAFLGNANLLDIKRETPYWSSDVELLARGFSAVIHDRMAEDGIINDFATRYSAPDGFGTGYLVSPNPEGIEREAISLSAANLLRDIQHIAAEMVAEAADRAEAAPTAMLAG